MMDPLASEGAITVNNNGALARAARTYPVTASVAAPYLLLIVPSAVVNANPSLGFIVGVLFIAITTTFVVESLLRLVSRQSSNGGSPRPTVSMDPGFVRRLAIFLIYFGLAASIVTALMGVGTIEAAVGVSAASSSPIVTALALVSGWDIIGTGLFIWGKAKGHVSSRQFYFVLATATLLKLVHVVLLGITVQLWRYLICIFFMLIYFGLIRLRTIVIAGLIVIIAWPIFFDFRNQLREERGVAVSSQVDASDRIRYDLQIARADGIPPGLEIGQLDNPIQILRFGLIPRFLDPDRADVATGRLINQYLGGSATSSYTFLPVTTSYVLGNWYGTMFLYAWWSVFVFILMRNGTKVGPYRAVIFAILLVGPLNWFTVYPDSAIGFLQDLVAALPVFVLMVVNSRNSKPERIIENA